MTRLATQSKTTPSLPAKDSIPNRRPHVGEHQTAARPSGIDFDFSTISVHASPVAAPIQLKASPEPGEVDAPTAIRETAAAAISSPESQLPFLAPIQHSFGRYDVSSVRAHTGSTAATSAAAIGATAFAAGDHVAFGVAPTLHTAAHEAAHVVQQRAGVSLPDGVGRAGDQYERHADEVADRVVQGQSSEGLLDSFARGAPHASTPAALQMKGKGDDAEPEPILPKAKGAGALLQEARGLLEKLMTIQISDEADRAKAVANATYMIVGKRLTWYRCDGSLIQAFDIAAPKVWAPGFYFRSHADVIYRYVRMLGTTAWPSWKWGKDSQARLVRNWLHPADLKRFAEAVSEFAGSPVLIVIPSDTKSTQRDGKAAERLIGQVRARMEKRGSAAAGSAGQKSTGPKPRTEDHKTPQQKIGEPPDRVIVWSNEHGVYVNVFVDRAGTSVEVTDGENAEDLEKRIQNAAADLRRSRDPENSTRVQGKPQKAGFTGKSELAGLPGATSKSNTPAYPSSIRNNGADVTVPGSATSFEMELDFAPAGGTLLDQVGARMQVIEYYWELLDVTGKTPESKGVTAKQSAGTGTQITHGQGFRHDVSKELDNVVEDTGKDLDELADSSMPWVAKSGWLSVVGISDAVRLIGAPISSFISRVTEPLNSQKVVWDREGDFLLRCVATPQHNDGDAVIRASSVAVSAVRVENIHHRATSVASSTDQEIAALEAARAKATSAAERTEIDKKLATLRQTLTATTGELGDSALKVVSEQLATAIELQNAQQNGIPREKRSWEARLLAVQVELQNIDLAKYIDSFTEQKKQIKSRLELTTGVAGRMPNGNHHPRVVLVSEETGQVNDLLMVLGEATGSTEGARHYLLADVTIPSPHDRYVYEGRSTAAGLEGHSAAIREAFVDFRENNGYGRGTIAIRLPSTLEAVTGRPLAVEKEMRSAPGQHARVIQRLKDLATAAEVAGLFLSGPAALAVGVIGGVAGAIVAVDSISRRRSGVDFSWVSFETIMDISTIVGGAAALGSVAVLPLKNLPKWATRVERIEGALHIFGITQLGAQVIVIPAQLVIQLQAIENDKSLTPAERAARRAEAFLQAVRSGIVLTVSAAQMAKAAHSNEAPRTDGDHPAPAEPTTKHEPPRTANHPTTAEPKTAHEPQRTKSEPTGHPAEHATPGGVVQHPRGQRVATLEAALGDLHGKVQVVETNLKGKSARVRYRDGEIRIEVGPSASVKEIQSHTETARTLLRFHGPLGAVHRLVSRILEVFTRIPGYGTRGFESRLEVRKLRQIIDSLQHAQAVVEKRFETTGTHERGPTRVEAEAIGREIEMLETQLRYHEAMVNSLDPGSGHVAAYDTSTRESLKDLHGPLDQIEAGLTAAGQKKGTQLIDTAAKLRSDGRLTGLEGWIQSTAREAGMPAQLRARMSELQKGLALADTLPADGRVVIDPAPGRFQARVATHGTQPTVYPPNATPHQIQAINDIVARVRTRGGVINEQALTDFLYQRRSFLEGAIRELSGVQTQADLESILTTFRREGVTPREGLGQGAPHHSGSEAATHSFLQRLIPDGQWESKPVFLEGQRSRRYGKYAPTGSTEPDVYSAPRRVAVEVKTKVEALQAPGTTAQLGIPARGAPEGVHRRTPEQQSGRRSSLPHNTEQWLVVDTRGQGISQDIPEVADQVLHHASDTFTRVYLITDQGFVTIRRPET